MIKVITFGSFDLFHEGHYNLLKRAKELGDYLIVGVTTEQYDEYRGKLNVVDSLMDRVDNVRKTGFADKIIIEDHEGQKLEEILKNKIDIFTVGSDWKGKFDHLTQYCRVVYLDRTKNVSSTMLRAKNYSIIRLGIIGTGRIARRFAPEVKYVSGINLEAVFNPNLESAKKYALDFELKYYTNSLEKFFSEIDAVYIASPHTTHYKYIMEALSCGKHVLCEKPVVLEVQQAKEAFSLAAKNKLVLAEGIKTAYCPGFSKLLSIAKIGRIGHICDVEACFTKLVEGNIRELKNEEAGGSVTELASYPLMAIFKLLGTNYTDVYFVSVFNENVDIYTKIYLRYNNAIATAKVGLGVKSEGQMIISGTQGYIYAVAPWWKMESFEVCHENMDLNEKFYTKYLGEGLRYEISDFVSIINGNREKETKLTPAESEKIAEVIEVFLKGVNITKIKG